MGIDYKDRFEKSQYQLEKSKKSLALDIQDSLKDPEAYIESEELAKRVNSIAEAEGRVQVYAQLSSLHHRLEKEEFLLAVMSLLVRGPDDTWSGRGNDVRRAFADGRREALDEVVRDLRYGSN